jgi:hypothetical protein
MNSTSTHGRQVNKADLAVRTRHLISAVALVLAFCAPSLHAHPGHSLRDADARHLITSPDHLAVLALGGLGLWFAARFVQRRSARQLLQGLGLLTLVAAAVLWRIQA